MVWTWYSNVIRYAGCHEGKGRWLGWGRSILWQVVGTVQVRTPSGQRTGLVNFVSIKFIEQPKRMVYYSLWYINKFYCSFKWFLIVACDERIEVPCIKSGSGVLQNYGYTHSVTYDLAGLAFIYIACHIIGFLAFWKRSKKQAAYWNST